MNTGKIQMLPAAALLLALAGCIHTPRPAPEAGAAPLRGFMLPIGPATSADFETMSEWGATLVRYQMMRGWGEVRGNSDVAEFMGWLDGKLDDLLSSVLPEARKRGIKVIVDMHTTPGGRDESGAVAMFYDARFADAFVEAWRHIATRLLGNGDAIYGYDLVNEPVQDAPAPFGYRSLQARAAAAIREIDPAAPLVFEVCEWDCPSGFKSFEPLPFGNAIYEVHMYEPHDFTHQGIHADRPAGQRWPDPAKGWDAAFLRRALAPVVDFQRKTGCRILVGEFSAPVFAEGAENWLADCVALFAEYGWDWTYHAFREWEGWSLEHEGSSRDDIAPSADNPRKRVVLGALAARPLPAEALR